MEYKLPRLTSSFRAFSDLVRPNSLISEDDDIQAYRQWKANRLKEGLTWTDIQHVIEKDGRLPKDTVKHLHCLRTLAVDLTGGEQSKETVDEAAVFLLRLFLCESLVSQKHLLMLKQMFGSVSSNLAAKVCHCVSLITSQLSDECIEYVKSGDKSQNGPKKQFGKNIKFIFQRSQPSYPNTSFLVDLSASIGSEVLRDFSMKYDDVAALISTKEDIKKNHIKKNGFGKSWLEKEVRKYYQANNPAGLSPDEFADTIVNMLKSGRSNDELQNELFDLLGFDRFELIQSILQHRNDIILGASVAEEKKSLASQSAPDQRRPNYGCQVVVQSEQEKHLLKQVRKEEKKLNKAINRNDEEDVEEPEFNPVELRAKRQAALKTAMNAPIFQDRSRVTQSQEKYPHVYDSQRQVQQSSGFIAGVKVMLSSDVKRTDNKQYEEVNIPVSEPAPLSVGNNLVSISSLDEIGQMAFQGVKTLNRIQSIVFDTAYRTNENLLICAPTGAGKTNVALLTIVHQIRQFIDQGVIKKDQFKIVYVAPMKALAAEMTQNFNRKLNCLGISVKELTGDMQLTKSEILQTQMLVTTPEKWDVVTRKGTGDVALTNLVKLLIIDEVHLLHGDRGPVVEALVARTLRLVESSQSMIRIVGLSATLPNYVDVAKFLRVNPYIGLFYFDSRFRPVPLSTTFVGVKAIKPLQQMSDMDQICYEKVVDMVQKGHQVMVFVHARNATVRTAMILKEMALQHNQLKIFEPDENGGVGLAMKALSRSRNKQLGELFPCGFSVHHAGMLRCDRSMVEKYFGDGLIKVLVCTSTLAWGVNLPAHCVIIRGTEIYDAKHGSFVDLGILDVLQIFGRAGRPQFDRSGHGVIITAHEKLSHYLSLLTNQFPIESNFIACLIDNLNAEVTLGTISNVDEAVQWLSYTYLFVRMKINPQCYGINYQDVYVDPTLEKKRRELIECAAQALDKARMVRFNARTGDMNATDLGRTASHFYIKHATVEIFNGLMAEIMTEADILSMISESQEFEQLKVRDDELEELDDLTSVYCKVPVKGGSENLHGKVNILLQTFLSRGRVNSFSLMSDQAYITQNAVRITRALFDIVLRKNNPIMSARCLTLSKMFEQQQWVFETPMRQFRILGPEIIYKIEDRKLCVEKLREMDVKEIGTILRHAKMGDTVKRCADEFPFLDMEAVLQPITRTVLRIRLHIRANFRWNDKVHGKTSEAFYVWIEDPDSNYMYHSEFFLITKKQVLSRESQELVMTIPLIEPIPSQYSVTATSDRWLGSVTSIPLTVQNLILPESHPPHTDLLELQPLPVKALQDPQLEMLYPFEHFNPIQSQIFHCLYYTDNNVLLGAPTGSGKTIAAEIAMFRVFKKYPGCKVVYIAPLKALVRERIGDWKIRLEGKLNRKVVELTGDVSPDIRAISEADVIVTTPEKWDGISRSWQTRNYVRDVALIVIDEIHLLGEDRGPVLEVIVSRTNFIASHTSRTLRIVGLSTALANAKDLADWLGIGQMGLYNFRPSVRPVPLEVHISGFHGKHYCPRMGTMNRPTFQAIRQYSPAKPALVFVSSRRQTRLTALDLIAYLAAEDDPKQWLHMSEQEMQQIVGGVKDSNLKLTLAFGIGMHHAGLQERDRKTVEELFVHQRIQILIATATLAWGVNFPAHLVVIKGTEYYDGKTHRYVDMPITDVLQMMGRAGRPQFDDSGIAVVLVHDVKKNFYKKFLYEPFPVESSLLEVLPDHLNAEIVAGTVQTKQDALDYLTWTYFFRRLLQNPTYYKLETLEPEDVNGFLSNLVQRSLNVLGEAYCISVDDDCRGVHPTSMGRIASFYYLSHQTMQHFQDSLRPDSNVEQLLKILSDAHEYDQLPVRHNEDGLNGELAKSCPLQVDQYSLDSPHTKALLLLQAHFSRLQLPCTDYLTDLKSVLDQTIRILQAMIDVCAERGWMSTTLRTQQIMQMVIQARWVQDSPLLTLPHLEPHHMYLFMKKGRKLQTLPLLRAVSYKHYSALADILRAEFDEGEIEQVHKVLCEMPVLNVNISICGWWENENVEEERHFKQPPTKCDWIQVHADQEYTLMVRLERVNRAREPKVHSPRFPRGKDEGWFLTLGCIETGELLAMKRVSAVRGSRNCQQLTFFTPKTTGRLILTLYILSDCYLGLDQQYDLQLDIIPVSLKVQTNTELKESEFISDSNSVQGKEC
ncbi:activating signal cointegrator 1 complex subunit 3 isoform X2 [Zootermopsis nevadensis]|nr:activating signal cointegrator 1 complex subunit 3 isoform X2 [Zootermopsis nevadensis]XP_021913278.1 activating signal cointegrator 1 complex subunit 3 isoform X2 [Zootermopsis nevadensis]XP_021913279.1 activating signal cointegrator 1 complex subunit 3 isoform X2 [Zootermopsis nevadensis]